MLVQIYSHSFRQKYLFGVSKKTMMKKKIAFMYFEEIHMIHHFIGIASELYKMEDYDVDILTHKGSHEYLFSLLRMLDLPSSVVKQLSTKLKRVITEKIKGRERPSTLYLQKKNKNLILSYDALVFTDTNHEYLYNKSSKNKNQPKFIFVSHGVGFRNHPFAVKSLTLFDLILPSGISQLNMYKKYHAYTKTNFEICGYSKFDVAKLEKQNLKLFNNNKPIVLYNPHQNTKESSWYSHGKDILEFFYNSNDYNLIFAPHIHLFNLKGRESRKKIDAKYYTSDNIHIDLGSKNSVNMAYTLLADIYLGDSSSQVFEFTITPRPCIFINRNNVDYKTDRQFWYWKMGKVISDLDNFNKVLETSNVWQNDFINTQIEFKTSNYDIHENESSSIRAAKSIAKLLNE